MRWPWSKATLPDMPPAVTSDERNELEEAKSLLAKREAAFVEKIPEIDRVTGFIRREQQRNHLAERFRLAFGGEVHGRRN